MVNFETGELSRMITDTLPQTVPERRVFPTPTATKSVSIKYRMSVVEQNYSILFYGTNVYTAIVSQCVREFSDLRTKKTA